MKVSCMADGIGKTLKTNDKILMSFGLYCTYNILITYRHLMSGRKTQKSFHYVVKSYCCRFVRSRTLKGNIVHEDAVTEIINMLLVSMASYFILLFNILRQLTYILV